MIDQPLLSINNLQVAYGGIQAVRGIGFELYAKQTAALIGSNGAGKSSTLNAIMGLIPASGSVQYNNKNLLLEPAHQRISHGISLVPEGRGIFRSQTVEENLLLGAYRNKNTSNLKHQLEEMYNLFPKLSERRKQLAGTLSGGEQQMLAMTRALMSKPKILLLDEPSMGLAPVIVDQIFELIQKIANNGTSILLIEQNAKRALEIAQYAYVIESGNITLSGNTANLSQDERVRKAYLGEDE